MTNNWNDYDEHGYGFDRPEFPPTPFEIRCAKLVQHGMRALEVGTGPGRFVQLVNQRGLEKIVAIDPRLSTLERLQGNKEMADSLHNGRIQFLNGTWPELYDEVKSETFDLVFSQSCLHYLPRGQRIHALSKFRKILKRGGFLGLALKSIDNAWVARHKAERIQGQRNRWSCEDGIDRTFFTFHGLKIELHEAGFEIDLEQCDARILEGYEFPGECTTWLEVLVQR